MFHPYAMVQGLFEERLEGYKGPTGCSIISQEFYETDRSRGFVRGYSAEMLRGMGPVSTAVWGMSSGRLPWGEGHHAAYESIWDRTAGMVLICEDLPEPENRVTLDPHLEDADGIPAPKIEYRLSENSRKMLDHAVETSSEALRAAGAVETWSEAPLPPAGWHLMGTARMGSDPACSVVDSVGRAHDVRNLFIVDGSVFVTAGGVNPTNTLQAIALYVADFIKGNLEDLFD
jgi:choline dehydrogenase-like flavoprotein